MLANFATSGHAPRQRLPSSSSRLWRAIGTKLGGPFQKKDKRGAIVKRRSSARGRYASGMASKIAGLGGQEVKES